MLEGEGYRFHAPCAPPTGVLPEKVLGEVEAKPKGAKEPKLKDALHTLEQFLNGKPEVRVYGWPGRPRPKRKERACQREENFNQEEGWDE